MAHIEIPDVSELKRYGVVRRFVEEDLHAEMWSVFGVLACMTAVAVAFGDPLTPFYSFDFVFGVAAVFFFSITFSPFHGLVMAAGVLALMLCQSWGAGSAPLTVFLCEAPFLALFFAGLALLPNAMPLLIRAETAALAAERSVMERKVAELEEQLASVRQEAKTDHADKNRKEKVKHSTRTAVLHSFTRELLQSSSQREMLNVLFHTLTRVFGVQECAMMIPGRGTDELVIARIIHPDQAALENTRVDASIPLLSSALQARAEVYYDEPQDMGGKLQVSMLVPVLVEQQVYALFAIGGTKSGRLQREEADFVITMSDMTNGAIEQLRLVLAS